MAITNYVSASLSSTDIDDVLKAVQTIRSKMPFLKAFSDDEKAGLIRVGNKSVGFMQASLKLAQQHGSTFLPTAFDVKEMTKDIDLLNALLTVRLAVSTLNDELESTILAATNDAYSAALAVYQYAKNGNVGTASIDSAVDELAQHFVRRTKAEKAPKPEPK